MEYTNMDGAAIRKSLDFDPDSPSKLSEKDTSESEDT